jgi:hypothetical protein
MCKISHYKIKTDKVSIRDEYCFTKVLSVVAVRASAQCHQVLVSAQSHRLQINIHVVVQDMIHNLRLWFLLEHHTIQLLLTGDGSVTRQLIDSRNHYVRYDNIILLL